MRLIKSPFELRPVQKIEPVVFIIAHAVGGASAVIPQNEDVPVRCVVLKSPCEEITKDLPAAHAAIFHLLKKLQMVIPDNIALQLMHVAFHLRENVGHPDDADFGTVFAI